MYCKKCGNEINSNARFCPKCGTKTRLISINQKQFDALQKLTIISLILVCISLIAIIITKSTLLKIVRVVFFTSLIIYLISILICVIASKINKLRLSKTVEGLKYMTIIFACLIGIGNGMSKYQQKEHERVMQLGIQHNEEYAKEQKEKLLTELVGKHKAIYGGSGYLQLNKDYSFKMQCTDNYGSKINIEGTFYFSNGSIILKIKRENGYDLGNLSYTQEVAIASDNLAFGYTFKFER